MLLYYNQETFIEDEYDETSIKRESEVISIQSDEFRPNWVHSKIAQNYLSDRSDYLQISGASEKYWFEV